MSPASRAFNAKKLSCGVRGEIFELVHSSISFTQTERWEVLQKILRKFAAAVEKLWLSASKKTTSIFCCNSALLKTQGEFL